MKPLKLQKQSQPCPMSNNLISKPEWLALLDHKNAHADINLNDAFKSNPERFSECSVSINGLLCDYSKNLITHETLGLLVKLAKACGLEEARDAMFSGQKINETENRAVLHTALRDPDERGLEVDGEPTYPFIQTVMQRLVAFKKDLQSGSFAGFTGKKIDTIVNIGIGGSHLGPNLAVDALRPFHQGYFDVHFVSNIDGASLSNILARINPETTLFIVASKSFSTLETMQNAISAKEWMIEQLGDKQCIARHFIAVSTNEDAVRDFGIDTDYMFPFKNWVGGRYSLWSPIGLPVLLSVGYDNFRKFLDGAHAMDTHFREAPLQKNIPVIMAMLGIWYRNFWDAQSHAILPYSQDLDLLPSYLQQLDMESNGKNIDREGQPITDYDTAPVIFGQPGTNAQHAFMQMMHQGTTLIPSDFIGFVNAQNAYQNHQSILLNNMLAQAQALMQGRAPEETVSPPRTFTGNHPSTTLLFDTLNPHSLGMLLALYEHKIFVQGIIWNINSFDQFGVELGKEMAHMIEKGENRNLDGSTDGLLAAIHAKSRA